MTNWQFFYGNGTRKNGIRKRLINLEPPPWRKFSKTEDVPFNFQRIATEGICIPVLTPEPEPWLDLALVIDESKSMLIWRHTIQELKRLLEHYGVFRDVRTWGLIEDKNGKVQIRQGMGGTSIQQRLTSPRELIDPSGRRLVLVVSDCVSAIWRNGAINSALKDWAKTQPVAIVQMLPQWLWLRTGLSSGASVLLKNLTPGVPNQNLLIKELLLWKDFNLDSGIKLPVLTLEPEMALNWSQMLAGRSDAVASGFVLPANLPELDELKVDAQEIATTINQIINAEDRVHRFRMTASPMARKLAGLLAAAPVINLPVVRLIQETMLSESRQVHVAEVFLGGLLKPLDVIAADTNPDTVQYEFMKSEIRNILLDSAPVSDSVDVLDAVSNHVAEKLGKSFADFMAVLQAPGKDSEQQVKPFAVVTAQILKRLGGDYARFAENLETQWISQPLPKPTSKITELKLTGSQRRELREAIINAYPTLHDIEIIIAAELDINLNNITSGKSLQEVVFHLIEWADATNMLEQLIEALYRGNPGNRKLKAIKHEILPVKVFFSYSHKDDALREQLAKHLSVLERQGVISSWDDGKILAGEQWNRQINNNLNTADIILLLLSPDFVASEYSLNVEVTRAMERHNTGEARVIPVILRPVDWHDTPFGKLQALPKNALPVTSWENHDEAFVNIAEGIRQVVEEIKQNSQSTSPPTLTFEFDVVTVNAKGEEIKREKLQASYFNEDLGNDIALEMVAIPGGKFMMGSPDGEGHDDEKPQHEVTVQPFFMGKYPITQAQWRVVASLTQVNKELKLNPSYFEGDNRPVEQVSWYDVVEFCERLSNYTGRNYRLPSEAEWEYACRAGTTTPFHFGETITSKLASYDASVIFAKERKGNSENETKSVGSFLPNAFGLHDMHGNVWEWCGDSWHSNYEGAPSDGTHWLDDNDNQSWLLRGGSWNLTPAYCRSAYRYFNDPDYDNFFIGFRVVCGGALRTL